MIDPKALGDEIDAGRGRQAFSPEERRLLMVALHAYASRSAGAESIAAKYFGSLASEATAADWAAVVGQLERELAEERFEHEETKRDLYDERKASLKSAVLPQRKRTNDRRPAHRQLAADRRDPRSTRGGRAVHNDEEAMTEIEVLRYERDHAEARFQNAIRHLTAIHALLNPPITEVGDKRYKFINPLANEALQALSDAIRAIPEELRTPQTEANYEPPTGWELRCEKCGRQQGMACGWPSNCPTGQGSREYVNSSDSSGDPQR